jgi:hypothetical protein
MSPMAKFTPRTPLIRRVHDWRRRLARDWRREVRLGQDEND